jgi:hypothetical protein
MTSITCVKLLNSCVLLWPANPFQPLAVSGASSAASQLGMVLMACQDLRKFAQVTQVT